MVLRLKEGLVECATVFVKSEVIIRVSKGRDVPGQTGTGCPIVPRQKKNPVPVSRD